MDDEYRWVGPFQDPDKYRLIAPLGQGGEARVWRAEYRLSDRGRSQWAIRHMEPSSSVDESSWLAHFELLKSIEHPGVVRVSEAFFGPPPHGPGQVAATSELSHEAAEFPPETPSRPDHRPISHRYLVMRLIEGETLREWLDEHPDLGLSRRLKSLRIIADALDVMHSGIDTAQPVSHGDIKPLNIVRRQDGSAVLVDLGLMRIADGSGRKGYTREYAAPELFLPGAESSVASDRFAFYATVVHLVLGTVPPTVPGLGPDLAAIEVQLRRHPLTRHRPEFVDRLMQALTAAPDDRPAPLAAWLASLTDNLSQTTFSAADASHTKPPATTAAGATRTVRFRDPSYVRAPHRQPVTLPRLRGRAVGWLVAAAVVLLAVLRGPDVLGYAQRTLPDLFADKICPRIPTPSC